MMRFAVLFALLCLALSASAQSAREARERLLSAADQLEAAEDAGDRVAALTRAVRAYDGGLASLRSELRRLTLREREIVRTLAAEDADISTLLALMQSATLQAEKQTLLHPGTAVETIRAGTLASVLVPALYARAAELEDRLRELEEVRAVISGSEATLNDGLSSVQEARVALADALMARTDLPPRLATNAAAMEALINSSDTLQGLADSLFSENLSASGGEPPIWIAPVAGHVLPSNDDPTGVSGWAVATEPRALVTAPVDASVRFSGEFQDQGIVTILEADQGYLVLFAGLSASFVKLGQVLAAGAPLGFAGTGPTATQDKLNADQGRSSLFRGKTLYIEVRQEGAPVDPATVLTLEQEQG